MKLVLRANSSKSPAYISIVLLFTSIALVQILFLHIQHIDAEKARRVVAAILRDENNVLNPQRASQTLLDLRETGFISCIEVTRGTGNAPFLSQSNSKACFLPSWTLNGERLTTKIKGVDGQTWIASFRSVNPHIFDITLWISRLIVVFVVGLFTYRSILKERRHQLILETERSKAEFAENLAKQVSHDIRSPLSALNMVAKSLVDIPNDKRAIIQNAATRINGIANDLLTKYKTSTSHQKPPIPETSLDLRSIVISELLNNIGSEKAAALSEEKKNQFKLDITGPVDAICEADEKELSRALSNLINNAIEALEYSIDGLVTLALRSAGKNEIAIIVSDNGKGIPEEILSRLGKEHISSGKDGTESGSGLGVLHAARAINAMNGKFSIQSKVGVGTIITIRFHRTDMERDKP